jgi:hypothetical protein
MWLPVGRHFVPPTAYDADAATECDSGYGAGHKSLIARSLL